MEALERSVQTLPAMHRMGRSGTPDPEALERALDRFRWICFPGFFGPRDGAQSDVSGFLHVAVRELCDTLQPQLVLAARSDRPDATATDAVARD